MAQTAVENIIEKLREQIRKSAHNKLGTTNRTGDYRIGLIKAIGLCKQAKEMEREKMQEIREMLVQGALTNMSCASAVVEFDRIAEQYYNETFK